ncbi:MAG: hypothetical protein QXF56_05690 [Candidatus Micrarchaeia archaeon]
MESRVYECEPQQVGKLKKLLESEPYAERSFAKQGYKLKEGKVMGEENKYYLYIKADADFFKFAEEKLKEVEGVKRSEKVVEQRVVKKIEEEEGSAEQGFGAIFG